MKRKHLVSLLSIAVAAAMALSACAGSSNVAGENTDSETGSEQGTDNGNDGSESSSSSERAEFDALSEGVSWDMSNIYTMMETDEVIDGNTYIKFSDANKNRFAAVKVGNPDTLRMVVELQEEKLPVLWIAGFEDSVDTFTVPDYVMHCSFMESQNFKHVTLNENATSIQDEAFKFCPWITSVGPVGSGASVEIPDTVEVIGNCAFYGCENLEDVRIPDNVKSIKGSAFDFCNIKTIEIPDTVLEIGECAIPASEDRESFTLPSSIRYFGCLHDFEMKNSKIEFKWNIPDCYTEITWYSMGWIGNTYSSSGSFTEVTVPDSVVKIDERLFSDVVDYDHGTVIYGGQSFGYKEFMEYFASLEGHEVIDDTEADNHMYDFCELYKYLYDVMELDRDEANRSGEVFVFSEGSYTANISYTDGRWNIELYYDYKPDEIILSGYFDENYYCYPDFRW